MGDAGGGIARLWAVLRKHRWTLEADLLHYWQVDLLDLHRGALSWRRLLVLYRALPDDSITRTYENGKPMWRPEAVLLDEIRRDAMLIATRGEHRPDAMPGSPIADAERASREAVASQRRREFEAAEAKERARQEWIAAERAEREHRCIPCDFQAKSAAGLAAHRRGRAHAARKEDPE